MAELFVSYKSEDRRRVTPLVRALRDAGLDVWWDKDIVPPMNWRETIAAQLDAAQVCLVVWTQGSVGPDGRFVREEAERAMARGAYFGVMLDAVLPPFGFGESQAADLAGWKGRRTDARVAYLVELIRAKLAGDAAPARSPPPRDGPLRRHGRLAAGLVLAIAAAAAAIFYMPYPAPSAADFARQALARQPCAWVEIADVAAEANGDRLFLSGAASSPPALRIALAQAAAEAGVRLVDIDITDIATADNALCDELVFLRAFKAEGRARMRVEQPVVDEPGRARFRVRVDVRGLPPHRALFGLDPVDGLYPLARNAGEIRRRWGFRIEPGREWWQGILDHERWSALVMVTGSREIDSTFIGRLSSRSDPAFVDEFTRRARAEGWAFHIGAVDCDLRRPVGEPC